MELQCGLKFCIDSRVQQETPEEGLKTYQLKHCVYNDKDEDNSIKTLNNKNHQKSSQKFRQGRKLLELDCGYINKYISINFIKCMYIERKSCNKNVFRKDLFKTFSNNIFIGGMQETKKLQSDKNLNFFF